MQKSQATPVPDTINLDEENNWYDEAFAPGQTPSFAAFVRAHIDQQRSLNDEDIKSLPEEEVIHVKLPDSMSLLYHADHDQIGKDSHVFCFMSFLYDNHECTGNPKAASFTFIMQALSGKEKDIFKMMDRAKWNELATGMFDVLQQHPATTCRMFASGLVGYTFSAVDYNESPAYRVKLNNLIKDYLLPAHNAKPYVMFHDAIPPGYNHPQDFMHEDYLRMSAADQGKAYLMMEERVNDDEAYHSWLRTKMKACIVTKTDVAMAILDENRYSEDVLFTFDEEAGEMVPAIPEPREEPLELDTYLSGRFRQIKATDPVPEAEPPEMRVE